jgi:hypothetical protein
MSTAFGTLSLGELLDRVRGARPDIGVRFDFAGMAPGQVASYRGFYEHLAVEPIKDHVTVEVFRNSLQRALGATFEGYKGGTYRMHENTPVWVSFWGDSSGTMITEVVVDEYGVLLRTATEGA